MAQYYKQNSDYSERNNDVFEVVMLATKDGVVVNNDSPLPVTLGSENITITGNVNVGSVVSVESSDQDPVHVHICGVDMDDGAIPVTFAQSTINGFASFNNFGLVAHKGFTVSDVEIPVFAVRVKPGSAKKFYIVDYKVMNNNADASTIGYQWYNFKTVNGASYTWVDIGNTGIQYAIFADANATPNTFTHDEALHSGTVVGKDSSGLTLSMSQVPFTDGGMNLIFAARRLDSATKLDFWFNVTCQL